MAKTPGRGASAAPRFRRRKFSHRLRNRRERGTREPSGLDVVESNDGDIVWNALPEAREGHAPVVAEIVAYRAFAAIPHL